MKIFRGTRKNRGKFDRLDRFTAARKETRSAADAELPLERIIVTPQREAPVTLSPEQRTKSPLPTDTERNSNLRNKYTKPEQPGSGQEMPPRPVAPKPVKIPKRKHPILRAFKYLFITLFLLAMLVVGVSLGWLHVYLKELPSEKSLEEYRPKLISRLFSSDQELIGEYVQVERRSYVSISHIPQDLIHAVIAREDKNFYRHFGVDLEGIARAAYVNFKARSFKEGGSTLTQQLVKNLTSRKEKAMNRKVKEALMALKVEQTYSKQEILEMYLNQVYFGHGCYGVAAAGELYFGKETKDLNLNECAMLAGLIQRPETHSPFNNPDRAKIRRISVLRNMHEQGFITEAQLKETEEQPLLLIGRQKGTQKNLSPHFYEYVRLSLDDGSESENSSPVVQSYPRESGTIEQVGLQKLYSDGLKIETSLNFRMQEIAEQAVRQGLHEVEQARRKYPSYWGQPSTLTKKNTVLKDGEVYDAKIVKVVDDSTLEVSLPDVPANRQNRTVFYNADETWLDDFGVIGEGYWVQVRAKKQDSGDWEFSLAPESHAQGCLVALEVETGRILAMVGGYDFFEDHPGAKIIFPVQALLQPGSCFKPILYSYALANGWTPADRINELPLEYYIGGKLWKVSNFESSDDDPGLHGEVPLRRALVRSMNVVSVHLWNRVTNDNRNTAVSNYARKNLGMVSPVRPERASALGTSEMYPVELATVFASFANGGRRVKPYGIEKVTDHYGNLLVQQFPSSFPVLGEPNKSAQVAYLTTDMLKGVIRDPEGTAYKTLKRLYPEGFPYPVAGKTGTTNDCTDAWFCGYSPDIVTAVWVGFEKKKSLGRYMTGGKVSLPIWAAFMEKAIPTYHTHGGTLDEEAVMRDFAVPPGLEFVKVCSLTGRLANSSCPSPVDEAFVAETQPTEVCTEHGASRTGNYQYSPEETLRISTER